MLHKTIIGKTAILALLATPLCWGLDSESEQLQQRVFELEQKLAALQRVVDKLTSTPDANSSAANVAANNSTSAAKPIYAPAANFSMPPELLPEIGKAGAEVGLLLSRSKSPYGLNSGGFASGFIDLPLLNISRFGGGKLAYEISVGMSESKTTFNTTSNVAQVANLTVLNTLNPNGGLDNLLAAVSGTGPAPFPVTTSTQTKLRLLQVIPFEFKYTSTALDRWRIRPYGVLGFGTYVTIHEQSALSSSGVRTDANLPPEILAAVQGLYGGQSPFGAPLVAGQIGQAKELEAHGLPSGHGNLDYGYQVGWGVEYRVSRTFSLGFDNRYNRIAGVPGLLITSGSRLGFHF